MNKGRFSLLSLFGAVTFASLGCLALVITPSYVWASVAWTVTIAILAGCLVGCFFGTKQSRAYCAGFTLLGFGHMILFLAPWFDDHTGELLATRHIVDYVGRKMGHNVPDHTNVPGIWLNLSHAEYGSNSSSLYLAYVVTGQSLMTLVVALLGGLIGRWFARQRPTDRSGAA
jgi:hypothetical protein